MLSVDPSPSGAHPSTLQNGFTTRPENGHQDADSVGDSESVVSGSLMVKLVVMAIATVTRLQTKGECAYLVRRMQSLSKFSNIFEC